MGELTAAAFAADAARCVKPTGFFFVDEVAAAAANG